MATAEQSNGTNTNQKEWRVRGTTPAPSTHDTSLAAQIETATSQLEVLSRQLASMNRRVDGISYAVDQIRPAAERTLSDHQMVQAILSATEALAIQVQGLVSQRRLDEVDPAELARNQMQREHMRARERRQREVADHLKYTERLAACRQELTDVCPCGYHRGIRFIEDTELLGVGTAVEKASVILEDNICPKNWWLMLSHLAFRDGELSKFRLDYPFEDYLFAYSIL